MRCVLHTISSLLDSTLEAATVKFRGWRYGVKSSPRSDKWAIVIKLGRPCSQVAGGLICAFRSYFLKQNDNKSSLHKVPRLEWPFLLWLPGIKVVSILDSDGVMSNLVERRSSSPECSLMQTGHCSNRYCSLNVIFNFIIFNHKSRSSELIVGTAMLHTHSVTQTGKREMSMRIQTVTDEGECVVLSVLVVVYSIGDLNQQPCEHRPAPLTATLDRRSNCNVPNFTICQWDATQCENSFRQVLYKLPGSAISSTYASQ